MEKRVDSAICMSVKTIQPLEVADFKAKEISLKKREVPPYSNTGVLEAKLGGVLAFNLGVRPDYLKLSFKFSDLTQNIDSLIDMLFRKVLRRVLKRKNLAGWSMSGREKGQNGYKFGYYLRFSKEVRANLLFGGSSQRGWCLLEIRGGLCALLGRREWLNIWRFSSRLDARLGQIDLAVDDLSGLMFNVKEIYKESLENGARFLPPYRPQGKLLEPDYRESPTGKSLRLGTRDSAIMFRFYEKGKQLGHTLQGIKNPKWVRCEMVLRRPQKGELNRDIIHPDEWVKALMGHSRYLKEKFDLRGVRYIMPFRDPVDEPREVAAKGLEHLRNQYGVTIAAYVELMGSEAFLGAVMRKGKHPVLSQLTRFDVPAILEMQARLRAGGPASGSGALVACESDALEW
jgi:DNA relaxase NicK